MMRCHLLLGLLLLCLASCDNTRGDLPLATALCSYTFVDISWHDASALGFSGNDVSNTLRDHPEIATTSGMLNPQPGVLGLPHIAFTVVPIPTARLGEATAPSARCPATILEVPIVLDAAPAPWSSFSFAGTATATTEDVSAIVIRGIGRSEGEIEELPALSPRADYWRVTLQGSMLTGQAYYESIEADPDGNETFTFRDQYTWYTNYE